MAREGIKDADLRWRKLEKVQAFYPMFEVFLNDIMQNFMNFQCSDIQQDIGHYLAYGPDRSMIQAQRGQAKTTITACYAVWRLIHNPATRVLIVSAGGSMAKQISNWIIQIITGVDLLECMRPDTSNGDRSSVEAFDVHYSLKGPEKSASVACLGITSNMQGYRADLLIADDIESKKNSQSAIQREKLRELTKDFTSICSKGKIVYLGTPQSVDSVYNTLPARGYSVRIWPGRYPSEQEEKNYGNALAPLIVQRLRDKPELRTGGGLTGKRGQAIDPVILNDKDLCDKEIDQGAAYFQLQHMLDTRLMDADRYPLKSNLLVFMNVHPERAPLSITSINTPETRIITSADFPLQEDYFTATHFSTEYDKYSGTHMYVDPSGTGKNADELAYAITRFLAGYVFLVDVGGMPGGLGEANQAELARLAKKWNVDRIDIEDNFGGGAFRQVLTPVILKEHKCGIEGVYESGQKELRIIDVLEPVVSSRRLIVDRDLIQKDWESCSKYALVDRPTYSFFFQFARITRDKGALAHDDRLDAVAGSVRYWTEALAMDKEKERAKARQEEYNRIMNNPLGNGRPVLGYKHTTGGSIFERYNKR